MDRIKSLNDEINNIINQKLSWEKRIIELGGPDYILEQQQHRTDSKDPNN